ncbi:MAG: ECF-type sigma factor [Isosphaeraceae bacterium]
MVYDEWCRLAAAPVGRRAADHTLDATASVHEAYLRLVGREGSASLSHSPGGAEAMRRILVDHALPASPTSGAGLRHRVPLEDGALWNNPS